MSTILDALQKARREAREAREAGPDRLETPVPPLHRHSRRRAPVVVVVLLTALVTVGVLALTGLAFVALNDRLRSLFPAVPPPQAEAPRPVATVAVAPPVARPTAVATVAPAPAAATPSPAQVALPVATAAPSPSPPAPVEFPAATPVPIHDLPVVGPLNAVAPAPAVSAPMPVSAPAAVAPAAAATPRPFRLGSILYDDTTRIATVNGITLREGERYDDFVVLQIRQASVVVQRDGEAAVTLRMGQ